jgi:hypothetical protein
MNPNADFWTRKLIAFLHDPPHKPLDIAGHENDRATFLRQAGLSPEDIARFSKPADWAAAAADRFPFPDSRSSGLRSEFSGSRANDEPFRHPLGGSDLYYDDFDPPHCGAFRSAAAAMETFQKVQGGLNADDSDPDCRAWANFFLHWRRWPDESARSDPRTAFLPADTRLPDHGVWVHNSVVSALEGCVDAEGRLRPAFLLLNLGPVQDFIAQARSTRDLWSGSYLLSWLMAHAIKAVSDEVGPDAVVFPALRGQPLFDLLHRKDFACLDPSDEAVLTPTLPNRFLALVPADRAADLARAAEAAIGAALVGIAESCWRWFADKHPLKEEWRTRYTEQVRRFPRVTWQTFPWPEAPVANLVAQYEALYSGRNPSADNLRALHELALGIEHRDNRYFSSNDLNNSAFCWPYFFAATERLLAGRRTLRDFEAWNTDGDQSGATKDALSGVEESVGDEDWWEKARDNEKLNDFFKESDRLGAMNLIKRVWHVAHLENEHRLNTRRFVRFESVEDIAGPSSYVAVLALDGDHMGQWLSGERTPPLLDQLSKGAQEYFRPRLERKGKIRRPLSPSYHLQFSEALANFSQWLVRPIVEKFGGQLIYSGGDDVLAMLPVAEAFDCAGALRAAFRGDRESLDRLVPGLFRVYGTHGGFVALAGDKEPVPMVVPGPNAEVSVGVCIAHKHSPLQGMVRAARQAEKSAKTDYGRASLAVALHKRSGEVLQWGAKWGSGALDLLRGFRELANVGAVSGRFPYVLAERLAAYLANHERQDLPDFPWGGVAKLEFAHAVKRQTEPKKDETGLNDFARAVAEFLSSHVSNRRGAIAFMDMFRVAAFLTRRDGDE